MNPFFTMNPNDSGEERPPNAFEVDDETDVYFLSQAYEYHEHLLQEENRPRLTRNPIHRDREGAEERLMADYFDDYCHWKSQQHIIPKEKQHTNQPPHNRTPQQQQPSQPNNGVANPSLDPTLINQFYKFLTFRPQALATSSGEYTSKEFTSLFAMDGKMYQTSCTDAPQHNDVAE
ncbi:hypothetical protein Tco_0659123 [Tanacetum coccineum]